MFFGRTVIQAGEGNGRAGSESVLRRLESEPRIPDPQKNEPPEFLSETSEEARSRARSTGGVAPSEVKGVLLSGKGAQDCSVTTTPAAFPGPVLLSPYPKL